MADAADSKSASCYGNGGSSPPLGTKKKPRSNAGLFVFQMNSDSGSLKNKARYEGSGTRRAAAPCDGQDHAKNQREINAVDVFIEQDHRIRDSGEWLQILPLADACHAR